MIMNINIFNVCAHCVCAVSFNRTKHKISLVLLRLFEEEKMIPRHRDFIASYERVAHSLTLYLHTDGLA